MNEDLEKYPIGRIAGSVGFASGIALAFKHKTGFWKGWGYAIIGGLVVGGIGYGIDSIRNSSNNKKYLAAMNEMDKDPNVTYEDVDFR